MAVCEFCQQEMTDAVSCTVEVLHQEGVPIDQIRYGDEYHSPSWGPRPPLCGDCGAPPGGFHHLGCDLQSCGVCRGQMLSCGCRFDEDPTELFYDDDVEDDDDDDLTLGTVIPLHPDRRSAS
jgi:hypothetical protein